MPSGFQVFAADGTVLLDTTMRVGRILGVVNNVSSSGSVTDTSFSQGIPFATFSAVTVESFLNTAIFSPRFSVSGNTISWVFDQTPSSSVVVNIYYGVY